VIPTRGTQDADAAQRAGEGIKNYNAQQPTGAYAYVANVPTALAGAVNDDNTTLPADGSTHYAALATRGGGLPARARNADGGWRAGREGGGQDECRLASKCWGGRAERSE